MVRVFGRKKHRLISMNVENKKLIREIHNVHKRTGIELGRLIQMTTFDLLARIIKKTPVQFGRARAAWIPYMMAKGIVFDLKDTSQLRQKPESVKVKSDEVSEGTRLGSFEEKLRGNYKFITIVNAVPYILVLEFGSSKQAPSGMVRISMRELVGGLRDALKKLVKNAVKRKGFRPR